MSYSHTFSMLTFGGALVITMTAVQVISTRLGMGFNCNAVVLA